jgi:nucleoside-diphosphate-sugar epimerase
MRILVIGGTGFIGRFLVPLLIDAGHDVGVVHRPESTASLAPGARSIPADRRRLLDASAALTSFAPDVVVDLILSSGRQASDLMAAFGGHAERVVAITSMDVYRATGVLHGSEPGPLQPMPLREDSELRTVLQTYPSAQIAALQHVLGWLDDDYDKIPVERAVLGDAELPGTVLRLPMIYGPGDRLHRLFPTLKRMDDGRPAILMSDTVARWRGPRGYVENVAAAIALAVTSPNAAGRVYNVAEDASFSELAWTQLIASEVGWRGEYVLLADEHLPAHLRRPGNFEQHWVPDTTRIRTELGYREPIPRDEALRRTIRWERANPPPFDAAAFDYAAEDTALMSS